MSNERILSTRPGFTSKLVFDNDRGMGVVNEQNVDAVKESALRQRNEYQPGSLIGNTQAHHRKVAEIPETLYWLWHSTIGPIEADPTAWMKKIEEHNAFKTVTGRVW